MVRVAGDVIPKLFWSKIKVILHRGQTKLTCKTSRNARTRSDRMFRFCKKCSRHVKLAWQSWGQTIEGRNYETLSAP